MALPIYLDVHVPRAIAVGLRARAIDVLTAQADNAAEFEDPQLLHRALELGRLLFTRDDDLLREATARQRSGATFATVVYAHQLRVSIGRCIADLELIAKAGGEDDLRNHVFHLPLRGT